jgi:hypothetical protein
MGRSSFEVFLFGSIGMVMVVLGIIGVCGTVTGLFKLTECAREYVADAEDREEAKSELVWEGLRRGSGFVSLIFVIVGSLLLLAVLTELGNKGL